MPVFTGNVAESRNLLCALGLNQSFPRFSPCLSVSVVDVFSSLFAKLLKVSRSSVTIASGQTGRNKVIRVAGLSATEVRERLGL